MQIRHIAVLFVLGGLLGGCVNTTSNVAEQAPINWSAERGKTIVLVDPDVELSELTFGAVTEPRADWTATGKGYVKNGIAGILGRKNIQTVAADGISNPREAQLVKLHGAVGLSILQNAMLQLPTKGKSLDWTLGPGVSLLREHYKGDYALFVYVRDSYSSGSRKAMSILLMAPTGAMQVGFASLVDLRTGRIVWFNQLVSSTGSLLTDKGAATSVDNLLKGMPL